MSIKLYTGLQGSGKSYEVVSVVILGALREGRRVVSNIAGLEYEEMRKMLVEEGTDPANLGTIVQVDHADVLKPNFFRQDTDDATKTETVIRGGDVLVLDEIWRFWDKDAQVTPRQQNFFRMHRHMLNPDSGLSCEIVLISQDVSDVCRKIKAVIEKTYVMTKHTELGSDKWYRVAIYSRAKVSDRIDPINNIQKKYDPKFFVLYKSHSAGGEVTDPREISVDKRGTIFSRPLFKYGLPLALLPIIPSIYFLWHFFHKTPAVVSPAPAVVVEVKQKDLQAQPDVNEKWRVVGFYNRIGGISFVITDGSSFRVLQNPPVFKILPMAISVELPEGGFATSWTVVADNSNKKGLL